MMELEQGIRDKKNMSFIIKGLKNYILFFGLDNQIVNFYNISKKYYKDININIKELPLGSIAVWKPSMIVQSIFI